MPPRILYAEDHNDTRVLMALLLRKAGFEVVEVVSAAGFMERFESGESFDLYLLDRTFPDASGLTLCRAVRERDAATPILFYSARAMREEREEALSAGASAYLIKPDDIFNVSEHAARWIGSTRS